MVITTEEQCSKDAARAAREAALYECTSDGEIDMMRVAISRTYAPIFAAMNNIHQNLTNVSPERLSRGQLIDLVKTAGIISKL